MYEQHKMFMKCKVLLFPIILEHVLPQMSSRNIEDNAAAA